ncbi:hypothetical protein MKW98_025593, partial [Papaver atlanticum]
GGGFELAPCRQTQLGFTFYFPVKQVLEQTQHIWSVHMRFPSDMDFYPNQER